MSSSIEEAPQKEAPISVPDDAAMSATSRGIVSLKLVEGAEGHNLAADCETKNEGPDADAPTSDAATADTGDAPQPSLGKLFVGGVSWRTTEDALCKHFAAYGELIDVALMKNKTTGNPRGFGFVEFANPADAARALADEHVLDGRSVDVKQAVPKQSAKPAAAASTAPASAGNPAASNIPDGHMPAAASGRSPPPGLHAGPATRPPPTMPYTIPPYGAPNGYGITPPPPPMVGGPNGAPLPGPVVPVMPFPNGYGMMGVPMPSPPPLMPNKVFVGGLAASVKNDDFFQYFSKYGSITDAVVMFDRQTNRSRGFGFVTFEQPSSMEAVLAEAHELKGKAIEVKPAQPKANGAHGPRFDHGAMPYPRGLVPMYADSPANSLPPQPYVHVGMSPMPPPMGISVTLPVPGAHAPAAGGSSADVPASVFDEHVAEQKAGQEGDQETEHGDQETEHGKADDGEVASAQDADGADQKSEPSSEDGNADDRDQDGSHVDLASASSDGAVGLQVPVPVLMPSAVPIVPVPVPVPVMHPSSSDMVPVSMSMPPAMSPSMYMGHPTVSAPQNFAWQPQFGGAGPPPVPGGVTGGVPGGAVPGGITFGGGHSAVNSRKVRQPQGPYRKGASGRGRGPRGGGRGYGRGRAAGGPPATSYGGASAVPPPALGGASERWENGNLQVTGPHELVSNSDNHGSPVPKPFATEADTKRTFASGETNGSIANAN